MQILKLQSHVQNMEILINSQIYITEQTEQDHMENIAHVVKQS